MWVRRSSPASPCSTCITEAAARQLRGLRRCFRSSLTSRGRGPARSPCSLYGLHRPGRLARPGNRLQRDVVRHAALSAQHRCCVESAHGQRGRKPHHRGAHAAHAEPRRAVSVLRASRPRAAQVAAVPAFGSSSPPTQKPWIWPCTLKGIRTIATGPASRCARSTSSRSERPPSLVRFATPIR